MTKWLGGRVCDVCGSAITGALYDAKTKMGPWATMCETDFQRLGVGLGTGRGQKYEQQDADFVKIEG